MLVLGIMCIFLLWMLAHVAPNTYITKTYAKCTVIGFSNVKNDELMINCEGKKYNVTDTSTILRFVQKSFKELRNCKVSRVQYLKGGGIVKCYEAEKQ